MSRCSSLKNIGCKRKFLRHVDKHKRWKRPVMLKMNASKTWWTSACNRDRMKKTRDKETNMLKIREVKTTTWWKSKFWNKINMITPILEICAQPALKKDIESRIATPRRNKRCSWDKSHRSIDYNLFTKKIRWIDWIRISNAMMNISNQTKLNRICKQKDSEKLPKRKIWWWLSFKIPSMSREWQFRTSNRLSRKTELRKVPESC